MSNESRDIKKSDFVAQTTVEDDATFDFVINNTNRKITKADLVADLGVTGSLQQEGDVLATPVLNTVGTVNNIRNIEDGPGVKASVSPQGGVKVEHDLSFDTTGTPLSVNPTDQTVLFRSLLPGTGVAMAVVDDSIQISATGITVAANVVVVNTIADFPSPVGGVITLADSTAYLVSAHISTANRFVLGDNTVVYGADSSVSSITYTGSDTMFTSTKSAKITRIKLACATGDLLSLTGTGSEIFQLVNVTITSCDTIGTVSNYSAIQITDVSFEDIVTDGLSFSGTFSVAIGLRNLFVVNGGSAFDLGTSVFNGGWSFELSYAVLAAGTYYLSGAASSANIAVGGLGTLYTTTFLGSGTPLNTIASGDERWQFLGNNTITDSGIDGTVIGPSSATDNAIARYDGTTGKLVQDSGITIDDSDNLSGLNSSKYDSIAAPSHAEGLVYYDSTKKALTYYNDESEVALNIGQETYVRVYNNSGADIVNGKVVYIDSSSGGLPTIQLAQPDEYDKSRVLGVATHTIEDGTNGYVTKFGVVGSLNTDAFSVGDSVYLTDDGALTTTTPTGGDFRILVGIVLVDSLTIGEIFVSPCIAQLTVEVTDTNGFPPGQRTGTTIAVNDSTREFSITPSGSEFYYYIDGNKYMVAGADTVTFADTEGGWVIYYDGSTLTALNNPTAAQTDTIIRDKCIVAYLYWDAANNKTIYLGDERHDISMSPSTHAYLHFTRGAQFLNGIALSVVSTDGNGDLDESLETSSTSGYISDEDIVTSIGARAINENIPLYYKSGASAEWRRQYVTDTWQASTAYSLGDQVLAVTGNAATRGLIFQATVAGTSGGTEPIWQDASGAVDADGGDPCGATTTDNAVTWTCVGSIYSRVKTYVGGSYLPAYNQFTGGAWQQTEVTSNNYFLTHYFATNDINNPLIIVQGENLYGNVGDARVGANNEISDLTGGSLVSVEFVPIASVIYQANSGYDNFAKARVRITDTGDDYVDWRFQELTPGSGVTSHGNLAGLENDDHPGHPWLLGRSGGQTLIGGTDASDDLTLQSTSNATRGQVVINDDLQMPDNSAILLSGETAIDLNLNGAVELYYDNAKKLETTISGASVTHAGDATFKISGDSATNTVNLTLEDSGSGHQWLQLMRGTDFTEPDVLLFNFYDGSTYADWLKFDVPNDKFIVSPAGETSITATKDGAVELYYDGFKKIQTSLTGATVSGVDVGVLQVEGNDPINAAAINLTDTATSNYWQSVMRSSAYAAEAEDFITYYYDGSFNKWQQFDVSANKMTFSPGGETSITATKDGAVELYYDANKRLETTSVGAKISTTSGIQTALTIEGDHTGNSAVLTLRDGGSNNYWQHAMKGSDHPTAAEDMTIIYNGTPWVTCDVSASQVKIMPVGETSITATKDGAVELYYDGASKFQTTASGCYVYNAGEVSLSINGDSAVNCASFSLSDHGSTHRWANIMRGTDYVDADDYVLSYYNGSIYTDWLTFDISDDEAKFSKPVKAPIPENVHASTATLTADDVQGGLINNYGQAAANTQTLPAAAAGYSGRVVIGTAGAGAFNLKAGASDKIYLDGVALDDGDKATLATPAVGDTFKFYSFQTGASSYDWIVVSEVGTLTDGGA